MTLMIRLDAGGDVSTVIGSAKLKAKLSKSDTLMGRIGICGARYLGFGDTESTSVIFSVHGTDTVFNSALGLVRTFYIHDSVFPAHQLMVVHEELLYLTQELFADIAHVFDFRVSVIPLLDSNDTIVASSAVFVDLFAFDHADHPALQQHARICRLVHQYQYVRGIAILGFGGGNETKIVRKHHAGRKDPLQLEYFLFRIVRIFVPAALGCFDDYLDYAGLAVVW
jgi:hypothetical protein